MSAVDSAAETLALRLRDAAVEAWDLDRCALEARGFIAELRHRGWSANPDSDWRPRTHRPAADPGHVATVASEARAAIRANRDGDPT